MAFTKKKPAKGRRATRKPGDVPLEQSNPKRKPFVPEILDSTVIAVPLLRKLKDAPAGEGIPVMIDLNLNYPGGVLAARRAVLKALVSVLDRDGPAKGPKTASEEDDEAGTEQYIFITLLPGQIRKLVQFDEDGKLSPGRSSASHAIYHVWPDFPIRKFTNKSVSTVKADAARVAFEAAGQGIVWAVIDSGIDSRHPHFERHANLDVRFGPFDFTGKRQPTRDPDGHGTHVAGIIAGERIWEKGKPRFGAGSRVRDRNGDARYVYTNITRISGMAPKCKLVAMRVLNEKGVGEVSNIIRALAMIQRINGNGRHLLIHGVNLSIGNEFEPEWFACGQSPLCVEVRRLVKSGVVVVVAAGNEGYGSLLVDGETEVPMGLGATISDPGNAEEAITVGATHRDKPHMYGVSYFSSKGPTGDGRLKPDLVAPGEKILSAAAGVNRSEARKELGRDCDYVEDSGTSMAAPHVSGVIAAFLSVRTEFIGQPERVKKIFMDSATDLGRERYFQGRGLIDLMRALQSI